jgi:hypothetical protein
MSIPFLAIVETYYPIFDLGRKNQEISIVFPLDSNKQRLPPVLSLARKQLAGVKMLREASMVRAPNLSGRGFGRTIRIQKAVDDSVDAAALHGEDDRREPRQLDSHRQLRGRLAIASMPQQRREVKIL